MGKAAHTPAADAEETIAASGMTVATRAASALVMTDALTHSGLAIAPGCEGCVSCATGHTLFLFPFLILLQTRALGSAAGKRPCAGGVPLAAVAPVRTREHVHVCHQVG